MRMRCVLFVCTLVFVLSGCDKYARYEVLTFFFTGVPHPDSTLAEEEGLGLSPAEILQRRREEATIASYAHGPYAAQQCYQCHTTSQSATFRTFGEQETGKSVVGGTQGAAGRLVMPIKELCIDCHTRKSVDSAFSRGLWVHGPVSEGICVLCHSPHASPYPYMLRKGNTREMCISCHTAGFIMETKDHQNEEDCTSCHNPHLGKNRYLLKKDFDESVRN